MTVSTLSRSQRAMQLERRTRNQWAPARIGIKMPSQSRPGTIYTVTLDSCTCPAALYHSEDPAYVCKHRIAAAILMGRK